MPLCRCGGFAAVGPAGRRYQSIAARPALSSNCEQCYVVSRRRKLNKNLLQDSLYIAVMRSSGVTKGGEEVAPGAASPKYFTKNNHEREHDEVC